MIGHKMYKQAHRTRRSRTQHHATSPRKLSERKDGRYAGGEDSSSSSSTPYHDGSASLHVLIERPRDLNFCSLCGGGWRSSAGSGSGCTGVPGLLSHSWSQADQVCPTPRIGIVNRGLPAIHLPKMALPLALFGLMEAAMRILTTRRGSLRERIIISSRSSFSVSSSSRPSSRFEPSSPPNAPAAPTCAMRPKRKRLGFFSEEVDAPPTTFTAQRRCSLHGPPSPQPSHAHNMLDSLHRLSFCSRCDPICGRAFYCFKAESARRGRTFPSRGCYASIIPTRTL